MRLLLLFLSASLFATDVTVCGSGCTYTTPQDAINAALASCAIDSITITAGETFSASTNKVGYRDCPGGVWLRSSRYGELPPVGTRVGPEHAYLMPTISTNVTNSPALYFFNMAENNMSAVDLGTETVTIASAIADAQPFSCTITPPPPMAAGTIYYSKYVDATHMQIAATPGGAAINLTGVGSTGGTYYQQPHCLPIKPVRNWRVTGINFTMPSGTAMQNALINIGALDSNVKGVPNNIWIDRNLIVSHANMGTNGPQGGVYFRGSNITIADNYIDEIRCADPGGACEAKPLSGVGVAGPAMIRNNFLGGGSIGILIGGATPSIPGVVSRNITISKNYFSQPGKNMYREGAGAPSGVGYYASGSGMFYRNTSSSGTTCGLSGRCYTAQPDGSWAIDLTATYRDDDYNLKNPIEIKEGVNILVEGNVWEGQQEATDSQGNCMLAVAIDTSVPYSNVTNANMKNNRCINTWGGISVSTYSGFTTPSGFINVENNLITGMGNPALLDKNGATNSSAIWQMRMPKWAGLRYIHNTHRPHASVASTLGYGLYLEDDPATIVPAYALPGYMENNLWWGGTNGSLTATLLTTCNSTVSGWGAMFSNDGTKQVASNVQFAGNTGLGGINACATAQNMVAVAAEATVDFETDSSLKATSPYSASNGGATFVATDGSDVGVDLLRLNTAINGVTTGTPGMRIQMDPGSVGAIARYEAPDNSACTVKLYNNLSRQTLNADTDTGGEQTDARAGSVTNGRSRQVVLGVNSALTASTPYWLTVACGSTTLLAPFRTLAAGSGTYSVVSKFPAAVTGSYSSSADMSSPTSACSAATTCTVPMATGVVRYFQVTTGPVQAFVAR